jgi:CAAX prenyl protease-like protein
LSRSALIRLLPFLVFMLLLALRGAAPADGSWGIDPRWLYGLGVALVGALLFAFRGEYGELARQNLPDRREVALAVAVGAILSVLWVNLDAPWMSLDTAAASFVPVNTTGQIDWPLVAVRWVGAALLVPVMEELVWRSFLMRWIEHPQFETVDPRRVGVRAVLLSTFVFVLVHTLWLAAVVAGLAYALLYIRTGKLWVAVIAHGTTNATLGVWVVATGQWQFW